MSHTLLVADFALIFSALTHPDFISQMSDSFCSLLSVWREDWISVGEAVDTTIKPDFVLDEPQPILLLLLLVVFFFFLLVVTDTVSKVIGKMFFEMYVCTVLILSLTYSYVYIH